MFTTLLCALSPAVPPPSDWPQLFGPDRSGVVAEADWSPVGAATPLWRRNVGLGYSCPSIVEGRLVTMGYDADAAEDRVLCLSAASGEELWVHAYAAADEPRYHGGGTLTTPTIADGVVYTTNRHGRAFALSLATGEVLWQRDHRAELGLQATFHGFCASPIVLEDRIVYVFGGTAVAVQRDGGALLWRTADEGDAAFTNATLCEVRGRTCIAVVLGMTFYVLDVEDGAVLHEYPWELQGNAVHCAQPLVVGDRVLLSTAYNKGAAMLRLGDERTPEVLWTSRRLRNKVTGLYLYGGHVYGFDESMLKCFDLDGHECWNVRGLGMGALSIVGGRLLVLSSNGELIVAEATPEEFRELSRRDVLEGGSYWTMPVLVDGRIYVRNSLGDLACLDHRVAPDVARAESGAEGAAGPLPTAAALFSTHAGAVGGAAIQDAVGLRLEGSWEILGRGMSHTPASLTLAAPDRWRLALDSGQLVHVFDGALGWEQKNGGFRLFDEVEAKDAAPVFALADLFAPTCPADAVVGARPESFGGTPCWRVTSERRPPEGDGAAPRRTVHHFDVATGRLVGREGDDLSTTLFQGELSVGDARLPARLVIFRAGSGQEETLAFARGEWLTPEAALFERPEGVRRLLRSPAELAADEALLRARYLTALGRYDASAVQAGDVVELAVERGELVAKPPGEVEILTPDPEHDGTFRFGASGGTLTLERDGDAISAITLNFGPESFRCPRLD